MSKLNLNLTKISENQPKLAVERFFVGQNIGLVKRAGEEKGWIIIIFTCNIYIQYIYIRKDKTYP